MWQRHQKLPSVQVCPKGQGFRNTITRHKAVARPYHRNGEAILDVHHAFGGSPEDARTIMLRHGAALLMTCPNMSESTVHRARHKNGFYSRLAKGERFN